MLNISHLHRHSARSLLLASVQACFLFTLRAIGADRARMMHVLEKSEKAYAAELVRYFAPPCFAKTVFLPSLVNAIT